MSHFLDLAAAFAAIEVAQGNAGIMLRWCLLHAIDCVPHARPPRRRYLRMVEFRVFDYVYKYVRPYIGFVHVQTSTHISVAGIYNGYNPPRQKLQAHFQSISRFSLSLLLVL